MERKYHSVVSIRQETLSTLPLALGTDSQGELQSIACRKQNWLMLYRNRSIVKKNRAHTEPVRRSISVKHIRIRRVFPSRALRSECFVMFAPAVTLRKGMAANTALTG